MEILITSEQETKDLATRIASELRGGDIVLLNGNLGAGKTTFTKYLLQALHTTQEVTSPTFGLMHIYTLAQPVQGITEVIHVDTYRMKDAQDAIDIGMEDYFAREDVLSIIEWPEKIVPIIQGHTIYTIDIEFTDDMKRKVQITKKTV